MFNPFEEIQLLYIIFQLFVKPPSGCGFRIADFGFYLFFPICNPQSPIRNRLNPLP